VRSVGSLNAALRRVGCHRTGRLPRTGPRPPPPPPPPHPHPHPPTPPKSTAKGAPVAPGATNTAAHGLALHCTCAVRGAIQRTGVIDGSSVYSDLLDDWTRTPRTDTSHSTAPAQNCPPLHRTTPVRSNGELSSHNFRCSSHSYRCPGLAPRALHCTTGQLTASDRCRPLQCGVPQKHSTARRNRSTCAVWCLSKSPQPKRPHQCGRRHHCSSLVRAPRDTSAVSL
jgi:hypothetical protein